MFNSKEKGRAYRAKAIANGFCTTCLKVACRPNRRACVNCAEKQKEHAAKMTAYGYDKLLTHYGRKCNCCGETNVKFLTIDHVNNDGYLDRQKHKGHGGWGTCKRIIEQGFPDNIQILCFNCNCGKARNGGICPHNTKELYAVSG